jgi:hypothetical protein
VTVNRRQKASLLWGVIGALSFLVLLQGYELLIGPRIDLGVKFGVALLVFVGAAVLSHWCVRRLAKGQS